MGLRTSHAALGSCAAAFASRRSRPCAASVCDATARHWLRSASTVAAGAAGADDFAWLEQLEQLPAATGFYLDSISRVTVDHYARGRVVLVGDSAYGGTHALGMTPSNGRRSLLSLTSS